MKKLLSFWKKTRYTCGAVIVAAGISSRMQGVDKILSPLGAMPVIVHTALAFEASDCIREVVIVARKSQVETIRGLAEQYGLRKVAAVVEGGKTRMESVQLGAKALDKKLDLIAIHDGARPMVTPELIDETVKKASVYHAAAPGVPVKDTVKLVDQEGKVIETPDRSALRAVQTPQVFERRLLKAAWKKAKKTGEEYTDDCCAMEAMGVPVYIIEGVEENLKITTPMDICLADLIRAQRE